MTGKHLKIVYRCIAKMPAILKVKPSVKGMILSSDENGNPKWKKLNDR
jgi:hypothetical protein